MRVSPTITSAAEDDGPIDGKPIDVAMEGFAPDGPRREIASPLVGIGAAACTRIAATGAAPTTGQGQLCQKQGRG